ncbi:MAG: aminopeptidase N [Bdellovibrionales bacterium]|nr:aminopeptidase N [Bdellovibrionales bacterium]
MKFLCLALLMLTTTWSLAAARKNDDDLTQALAAQRKSQIKNISYLLHFDLQKKEDEYKGRSILTIDLNRTDLPLSLDFVNNKILSLKVNGQELKKYPSRKGSLEIPAKHLKSKSEIEISYTGAYSKNSGGFLKSTDPEDGSEYVYTDFEPYSAHSLFPSFDQPDLKATFKVSVNAPKDWKVIQNELIDSTKTDGDFTLTTFKTTPLISTYLFFLGAGPFVEWTEMAGDIPMYLYARKTLEKYVDVQAIFKTTRIGLKFFTEYFNTPYPFSKYGQLFIPEFAWGGMENPGAVTLNEKNIFRGPVAISTYEKRDNLILHEMAHMWFGDLVTMEWWNDLWLNESFATYLASIAQDRALNSKGTWLSFFGSKTWGYWQDQLVTTHPIETDVPDVRTAKGNFDGITYAKGAAALKQLHFFVGEKGFKEGLQNYFKTFAFKNTQRKDFINAIAVASKTDLTDWTQKWLQTAGPNQVTTEFTCEAGKIKNFAVVQTPSTSNTLSPHRTKLGLFAASESKLKELQTVDVVYSEAVTPVTEVIGDQCPDFILPNVGDQDYALFTLDPVSLTKTKLAITTIPDPLSRMMVWSILSEMVRNQKLKARDYIEMAMTGLEVEENDFLLGNLLGRHSTLRNQYFLYLNNAERAELAEKFEATLFARVLTAKPESSLQMNFFDFYVSIVQSPKGVSSLGEFLLTSNQPKGITLDQDRRWSILNTMAANGAEVSQNLIGEELKRDPSTMGKRMAYGARAAYPDLKSKQAYWKEFFGMEKLPFSNFKEAASRFHGPNHEKLSQSFAQDFFKKVLTTDWKKHDDDVEIYFEQVFPSQLCNQDILKLSQSAFKKARNLTSLARRSWSEAQDELNRCVKVRSQGLKLSQSL